MKRKPIGKRELKQHIRFDKSSNTAAVSNAVSSVISFTAHEEIAADRGVSIGSDGEAYVATLLKPVTGISTAYTPADALIPVVVTGVETIDDAAFTIGADVWLCEPDGITGLNMTTTPPTVTAGQYTQRLGRAITAASMLIEVGAAVICE